MNYTQKMWKCEYITTPFQPKQTPSQPPPSKGGGAKSIHCINSLGVVQFPPILKGRVREGLLSSAPSQNRPPPSLPLQKWEEQVQGFIAN